MTHCFYNCAPKVSPIKQNVVVYYLSFLTSRLLNATDSHDRRRELMAQGLLYDVNHWVHFISAEGGKVKS